MNILVLCFFCTLVHVPSIILRYEPFRDEVSDKQKKTLLSLYGTALLLNAVLYAFMCSSGTISIRFYKMNLVFFCVIMAFTNGMVIRRRAREHCFTFGLTAIVIYLLMSTAAFIEDKLPIHVVEQQIALNAVILCIIFAILYPLLAKLMRKTITPFLKINSKEYWKNIWFIPVAMFFASLFAFPMKEHMTTVLQLVSRLMMGIATLFICRSISYDYEQLQKREELNQSLDRQKEYYQALAEKVSEARKSRHDFKHHVAALKAFSDKKDYTGLTEYINGLSDTGAVEAFIPFTGNSAADGIIYHYALLCEKGKISFQTEGMLANTKVSDVDLCVLLGNALDNAYAACQNVKEQPYIHLTMKQEEELLTITVSNTFDGIVQKQEEKILSRKRENAEGIGLFSMKSLCEKYGGDMKIGYTGQVFSLMLLLNNKV